MKLIVLALVVLLLPIASAQDAENGSNALDFIRDLNPLFLIIAGILLFFASHLAKFIAIILVIIGIAGLLISLL
jgi:hypothetical protein